jgi:hypothetical protein
MSRGRRVSKVGEWGMWKAQSRVSVEGKVAYLQLGGETSSF